ncbi:Fe-S oxidoreductase, partial [Singulisphaera rosea]
RLGFGDAETFREVVRLGHARGFTVSGDFLFNLPGQPLSAMQDDLDRAIEIGLDHLGLYHLVMFPGLGTEWSRQPDLLASLPTNAVASENWQELRGRLFDRGFYQSTLTNFEKNEFLGHERRFVYEELSFEPDRFDMVGFGPSGISFAGAEHSAVKVMNPDGADAYADSVARGSTWDREFVYGPRELRILHLTRRLAALQIRRADYLESFESDPIDDFPTELEALEHEGLVRMTGETIEPTPRGMFYADSIAALLAWRQVRTRGNCRSEAGRPPIAPANPKPKPKPDPNDSGRSHMG